eukprot:3187736-Pyramimonas_sp.AAC.1
MRSTTVWLASASNTSCPYCAATRSPSSPITAAPSRITPGRSAAPTSAVICPNLGRKASRLRRATAVHVQAAPTSLQGMKGRMHLSVLAVDTGGGSA